MAVGVLDGGGGVEESGAVGWGVWGDGRRRHGFRCRRGRAVAGGRARWRRSSAAGDAQRSSTEDGGWRLVRATSVGVKRRWVEWAAEAEKKERGVVSRWEASLDKDAERSASAYSEPMDLTIEWFIFRVFAWNGFTTTTTDFLSSRDNSNCQRKKREEILASKIIVRRQAVEDP